MPKLAISLGDFNCVLYNLCMQLENVSIVTVTSSSNLAAAGGFLLKRGKIMTGVLWRIINWREIFMIISHVLMTE